MEGKKSNGFEGDSIKCERRVLHMCQFIAFVSTLCSVSKEWRNNTNKLIDTHLLTPLQPAMISFCLLDDDHIVALVWVLHHPPTETQPNRWSHEHFFPSYHKMINNMKCMLRPHCRLFRCNFLARRDEFYGMHQYSHHNFNCKCAKLKDLLANNQPKKDEMYNEWKIGLHTPNMHGRTIAKS